MATIATTTNSGPFQYPGNTLLDRSPTTGYLYCLVEASTANTYDVYRSTNTGTSWSLWVTTTRTNVTDLGSIWITNDNILMWAYRTNESSQDRIYFRRIALDGSAWEAEVLTGNPGNGGVSGSIHQGVDLVAVGTSTATYVAIAAGTLLGGMQGVTLYGVRIPAGGGPTYDNTIFTGSRQWLGGGSGRVGPSLDIEHNGDGKSSATPHLWLAHGRTDLRIVKLAWTGAGWAGPTADAQIYYSFLPRDDMPARWDGNRFVAAIAEYATVLLVERNRANTGNDLRLTPTHPTGNVRSCTLSYNRITGDPRIYATGTSTAVLYYVDYVRATNTWTSWTQVLATAVLGSNADNFGVRRGSGVDARFHVYTAHSGAPNTLIHTVQTVSYAPNTPTWLSPANGAAADVAAALVLDWDFTDADPTDTQSAYALRRQIGAGTFAYLRGSDNTWQATEQKNTGSATSAKTLTGGWGAGSDANHSYAVKVWDSADTASGYSATLVVIPSVLVNPTITAPVAAAVITTDTVTVTWTAAEQTAYRLQLATNPGGVLEYDCGWVTSTVTSRTIPVVLADLSGWTITLQTRNNEGLASSAATRNFTVDYVEPPVPVLSVIPVAASGWIQVGITNPAPSGGQPALASQDVYRRVVGTTVAGVRVAAGLSSGATVRDWRAVALTAYEYRALARGANGTAVYSAWTA